MDNLITPETEQALSEFNNLFNKDNIEALHIHYYKNVNQWSGTIVFKNSNTKGEQRFESSSLIDILKRMENFSNALNGN